MSVEENVEKRLNALYDELDRLGDLRARGYSVTLGDVSSVKEKIRMLESLKNES